MGGSRGGWEKRLKWGWGAKFGGEDEIQKVVRVGAAVVWALPVHVEHWAGWERMLRLCLRSR